MLAAAILSTYITVAQDAARWIDAQPALPADAATTLYYGTPGSVLFDLNLYEATGDSKYIDHARRGGDELLKLVESSNDTGLYDGIAGPGYALIELWKTTHDAKYRDGALRTVQRLSKLEAPTLDIISGSAGTGLFLLYASRELHDAQALSLARCEADRLLALRAAESVGVSWADPLFEKVYPNFSHGTAGAAYFLATMYMATKDRRYLDAALAGGRHLISIATTTGNECLIYHHTPGGENLYYLGWCHGPAGTARLFYRLYQATGDHAWLRWVDRAAQSIIDSGIPDKHTPGFWNNVSVCCGSAGVARFFLDLYRVRHDRRYLDFAKHVTATLLAGATRDSNGTRWPQAENRVSPNEIAAQTGWMQGAAGIASVLLDLDAVERGKSPRITLPDSPF
jgi:lantibiotic modifying enzyme